jgi:hypothetical protein
MTTPRKQSKLDVVSSRIGSEQQHHTSGHYYSLVVVGALTHDRGVSNKNLFTTKLPVVVFGITPGNNGIGREQPPFWCLVTLDIRSGRTGIVIQ